MHEKTTCCHIKCMKWQNCHIFHFCFDFWKHFASMSCFYTLNFPTILGNQFSFYKFITIYLYTSNWYTWFAWILDTSLPLRRPYIYNILMVCNNTLAKSATPAPLHLISGNTVSFYRYNIFYKCSWRYNR